MPLGSFTLRSAATDVRGAVFPAGEILGWNDVDPDQYSWMEPQPDWLAPGLVTMCSPPGAPFFGGHFFAKSALDLIQPMGANVATTSQGFTAAGAAAVEIVVPAGKRVRYLVGGPSERASRDGVEPASPQIEGDGTPVRVVLQRGDMVHLVSDVTESSVVDVTLNFVLFG